MAEDFKTTEEKTRSVEASPVKSSRVNVFGIAIDALSYREALRRAAGFLASDRQHTIVTPNPEILLGACKDEEFWYILNQADLAIPDGVGLKFAAWLSGVRLERIAGADLMRDLLRLAEENSRKAAVLNWRGGLSKAGEIKAALKIKYPRLDFRAYDIGRQGRGLDSEAVKSYAPELLLVTLGSPYQERLVHKYLSGWPSVRLAMPVGGAFDFLTGKLRRAPAFLRRLGLEWLWRLALQPRRWKRIYRAVAVFPLKFIKWKFILPFFYRPNVVCLLYKKEAGGYKIFIVERTDKTGHWQLPQGGTRAEALLVAGARELSEEINSDKFRPVAAIPNLWQYDFGASAGKYKAQKHAGYRGQRQGLFIAEFLGKDSDIKINFWDHRAWRWVRAENLINEIHPVRREATKVFWEKFKEATKQ